MATPCELSATYAAPAVYYVSSEKQHVYGIIITYKHRDALGNPKFPSSSIHASPGNVKEYTPDFWICSKCYVYRIWGTRFRDPSTCERLSDDTPRVCRFSQPWMLDNIFKGALVSGFLQPALDWMHFRPTYGTATERPASTPSAIDWSSLFWPNDEVAATWWSLLNEVDLRWLFRGDARMLKTQCDYLPDDPRAAPAYAEVGGIVAMTAVAGAVSFKSEEQSAYPMIIGDGFQFDFRQHPTLGTVGAFSRHGDVDRGRRSAPTGRGTSRAPRPEQTLLALRHAQGDVKGGFCGFHDGKFINAIRQTDPGSIIENGHNIRDCSAADRVALCRCNTLYDRPSDHHLLWLITAAVPEEVPVIFPSGSTISPNLLTMLALSSRFWRAPRRTRLNETEPSVLDQSHIKWYPTAKPHAVEDEHIRYILALLISTKEQSLPKRPEGIDVGVENLDTDDIIVHITTSSRHVYGFYTAWKTSNAEAAITEDTFGFALSQEGSANQKSTTAGAPIEVVARHLITIKTLFEFACQYVGDGVLHDTNSRPHIDITELVNRSTLAQLCLAGRSARFTEQLRDMGILFSSILDTVTSCWEASESEREEKEIQREREEIWKEREEIRKEEEEIQREWGELSLKVSHMESCSDWNGITS
ncbi:hypothetical protein DL764_006199 [Monosporascus ibericus]|uniref:Uncharacterized protein n=1 Tax=Monosporascus ibericus TaxID=155417 RepID=A0A4Q4T8W3_9PEZI|nr:hypothetical protein DL764_006199 [Monosporascus ibericus]